jgi:ectoine hydroxylase-related dioxygenase (phytanoyl-CoA dioxygenase family)
VSRLSQNEIQQFRDDGYVVVRRLFADKVEQMRLHFMEKHRQGAIQGYFHPLSEKESGGDKLKQYPRMMHPHRYDSLSMETMLDRAVMEVLHDLYGEPALAAQSMFYFKPPGAKGQALHQDNFYLKVHPGTCIAAWTAVDAADEENGGLFVVPGSHQLDLLCPEEADPNESFTTHLVRVPEGMEAIPVRLQAGDVLFFNGSMIHGSNPNHSTDRFRRAFICHYAPSSATEIGQHYNPLYTNEGDAIKLIYSKDAGPCGIEFEAAAPH